MKKAKKKQTKNTVECMQMRDDHGDEEDDEKKEEEEEAGEMYANEGRRTGNRRERRNDCRKAKMRR